MSTEEEGLNGPTNGAVPKRPKGVVCKTIDSSVRIRPVPPIGIRLATTLSPEDTSMCTNEFREREPVLGGAEI